MRLVEEANLAAARVRFLAADVAHRVEAIAERSDTKKVVLSRNPVAMAELLRPVAKLSNLDGIIVVDDQLNIIGQSGTAGLIETQTQFHGTRIALLTAEKLAYSGMPPQPPLESFLVIDGPLKALFPETTPGSFIQVLIQPMFDDFGDAVGALIAHRMLRTRENTLEEFARTTRTEIGIFVGKHLVSKAGLDRDPNFPVPQEDTPLMRTADDSRIARCIPLLEVSELCVYMSMDQLHQSRNQLIEIGVAESARLLRWLFGVGIGAIVLFALIAFIVARQITRPLAHITDVVTGVAAGDCFRVVPGAERLDEVGNIARAVLTLQQSVRERDALRIGAIRQNAELEASKRDLHKSLDLLDAALRNMSHGLCMFDSSNRLVISNDRFATIYGIDADGIRPGMSLEEILRQTMHQEEPDALRTLVAELVPSPNTLRSGTVVHNLASGRTVLVTRQLMIETGWVAIYEDITESRLAQARLVHMANHDALTNLPNRALLGRKLEEELQSGRDGKSTLALIYLDLDEFKTINDSLGHPVGDQLLRLVAMRLLDCVRPHDLVARLGGDEFAIICADLDRPDTVDAIARAIIEAIGQPFQIDDHEVIVGASVGITIAFRHGENSNDLIKQADLALYRAKSEGKNTYRYYQPEMETLVKARRELLLDLRSALANQEFEPYFQPQVNLISGKIIGFEALLRWHHPTRGSISPAEFIPLAEETGLIGPIGSWMLARACEIAANWKVPARIAVNISSKQIKQKGLYDEVVAVLARTGLASERLELEITESILLEETDETRETLMQLKQLGVKISMDDFGTGYSSLSCLRSFPFDKIKIDQSFVRTMATDDEACAIVRSIIQLANTLGITTTAEGVETEDLIDLLREAGCTEAQGYLFGRPQPAVVAEGLLNAFYPSKALDQLQTVA